MTDFQKFAERETLAEADALALARQGVLALDPERALPLWFDGRFLTARDLNREQNYFLARQAGLARSIGSGVIEGLGVRVEDATGTRLRIRAGQGVAFDGAHLVVPEDIVVNLADLALQDEINARLGLSQKPGASIRARTGLFVLSLRAVEFTASPTASFPTTVTGERSLQMGERVEAAAVTLTPYAPLDAPLDSLDARSMAAQRLFQGDEGLGVASYALPLAMLSVRQGVVDWLDPHLVRRQLAATKGDFLGLGLGRGQLRLAHFNQYADALDDVVTLYQRRGQPPRFPAETHFRVLPAAGPVPAACIDPAAQVQIFFPGEMEVELSIVPADELPYLIEDSFELPPIDLTRPVSERDPVSVMVLAPVPRAMLRSRIAALGALARPLRPISLIGQGPLRPLDRLGISRIALADVAAARRAETTPATEAWAALLRELTQPGAGGQPQVPYLWYVRRRTLRENADLESVLIAIDNAGGDDPDLDEDDPVPPEPEVPEEPETPEEPQPDPLAGLPREVVARMAEFGALQGVAERVFVRLAEEPREALAEAILEGALIGMPLALAAAVMRAGEQEPATREAALDLVGPLRRADQIGMRLLNVALVGVAGTSFTSDRLKQLQPLFAENRLERAADAIGRLESAQAKEGAEKLAAIVESGSEERLLGLIKELEVAGTVTPPIDPRPGGGGEDRLRREAEAAADLDRRAAALVATLPNRAQADQLARALGKADPPLRATLVAQLEASGLASSRIATAVVLDGLATGGSIGEAELARVRPVDATLVKGLAAIEPHLLGSAAPAPDRPIGVRPGVDRRIGELVMAPTRDPVERRVGLLAGSGRAGALAEFARLNARTPARLAEAAARMIPFLDDPNATAATVARAVQQIIREMSQ